MQDRTPARPRKKTGPKPTPPTTRLLRRYEIDENGCWIWQGSLGTHGYGKFMMVKGESMMNAHRAAYLLLVGPISPGLHVDHLCRNRACINPEHLEPVTPRENVLRGVSQAAANARKTHCVNGHAFSEETTYMWQGARHCRICRYGTPTPKALPEHGTVPRYRAGCKCGECRGANAKKARERSQRLAVGPTPIKAPYGNRNSRKTHCPRGHEYTSDNTYIKSRNNGATSRMCRTCAREQKLRRREALREQVRARES